MPPKHRASLVVRARRNPAVLRRALRDPAKRAKLPDRMIPYGYKPITPGSDITNRRLKRQTKAAANVKYGPVVQQQRQDVGEAKAFQRDIGNYYDDYIRQVQAQSQNVQQIGQQAQAAQQGLQAGVTGLAAADLTQVNQAATKDAEARGATAGDLAQMGSNAAAVRQALVGSFAAQQAATNAAASTYAGNRANVVAPGQKLGAVAQAQGKVRQAREKLGETKRERGAFRFSLGEETRASEAKQVLARQALGLDVQQAKTAKQQWGKEFKEKKRQANIDVATQLTKAAADAKANSPGSQAAVVSAESMAREGAKYGYTYKDWKALGSGGRSAIIKKGKPGSPGATPKGRDYLTKGQSASGLSQLSNLKGYMSKAKRGELFEPGTGKASPRGRYGGEQKVRDYVGSEVKHPALVRAAADAVYDGHISAYTEKQLKAAGYKPRDVAAALGVPSHKRYMQTTTGKNTAIYRRSRAPQPQGHY